MRPLGYYIKSNSLPSTALILSIVAASIVVAAWVQHYVVLSRKVILYFETAKSTFATAIWLWLILDAAFRGNEGYHPPPRKELVIKNAICGIILL